MTRGDHYNAGCCFDYGNAETDNDDDGRGTMEALYTVPVAADASTGLVEDIMRPGYVLHGERVLRAAQVGVGEHR